jgi:hypothetical protein
MPDTLLLVQVMLCIAAYGLCCFLACSLDELVPIYASAAIEKGAPPTNSPAGALAFPTSTPSRTSIHTLDVGPGTGTRRS